MQAEEEEEEAIQAKRYNFYRSLRLLIWGEWGGGRAPRSSRQPRGRADLVVKGADGIGARRVPGRPRIFFSSVLLEYSGPAFFFSF